MRNLLMLLCILSVLSLQAALETQSSEWEENTEKVDQWYIEEAEAGPSPGEEKAGLDTTTRSFDQEVDPEEGTKDAQQDED